MFFYFKLQFKLIIRHISDFGIHPAIGFIICLFAHIGLSVYIFSATDFAKYVYILLPLSFILNFSEVSRNNFLKSIFSNEKFQRIRILENGFIVLPYLIVLLLYSEYVSALTLILFTIFFAFVTIQLPLNRVIPTPFYKVPFEFTVGFRNTVYVLFISWVLTIIAVKTGNFNLGIFSLLLVVLSIFTYFLNTEKEFFVWIYNLSARNFLLRKVRMALLFSTLLCLPVIIPLCIFFFEEMKIIIGLQLLSYLYLVAIVLAKYSRFPSQINLPETIIFTLCITFPPFLFVFIPFFYFKSVKQLKLLLE